MSVADLRESSRSFDNELPPMDCDDATYVPDSASARRSRRRSPAVDRLELRSDHPLGLQLLRQVLQSDALAPGIDSCALRQVTQPALWRGGEHALALCVGPAARRSPVCVELPALRLGLYASRSYLEANGGIAWPSDLHRHLVLDLDLDDSATVWTLYSDNAEIELTRSHAQRATRDVIQAQSFATSGLGLAWLPEVLAAPAVRYGQLMPCLQGQWFRRAPSLHLCLPMRHRPSADMLALVEAMFEMLEA